MRGKMGQVVAVDDDRGFDHNGGEPFKQTGRTTHHRMMGSGKAEYAVATARMAGNVDG